MDLKEKCSTIMKRSSTVPVSALAGGYLSGKSTFSVLFSGKFHRKLLSGNIGNVDHILSAKIRLRTIYLNTNNEDTIIMIKFNKNVNTEIFINGMSDAIRHILI